jgi:hypothetical protein
MKQLCGIDANANASADFLVLRSLFVYIDIDEISTMVFEGEGCTESTNAAAYDGDGQRWSING